MNIPEIHPHHPGKSSVQEATDTHEVLSPKVALDPISSDGEIHEPTRQVREFFVLSPEEVEHLEQAVDQFPIVGDEFVGFQLISELGRGAFGRVFLAQQGELADRPVALKIAPDVARESQRLARLQHTNIVPIYSVHRLAPFQAICMPYFGSTTLAHLIAKLRQDPTRNQVATFDTYPCLQGKSRVEATLWIGARLAEGLAHAHAREILHCDLKPANILMSDDGQPMLLDFNLAHDLRQSARAAVGGSLCYMAPEHLEALCEEGEGVDYRSDLYALGIILAELLTGHSPFLTHNQLDTRVRVAHLIMDRKKGAPVLVKSTPGITPAVESIIRHLLEPDPRHRYQSADELREDLERQLTHRKLKYAPEPSRRERWVKFRRRHPRLTSLVSLSVLASLMIAFLTVGMIYRSEKLAESEAWQTALAFDQDRREIEFFLTARTASNHVEKGLKKGYQALERFGLKEATPTRAFAKLDRLKEKQQEQTREQISEVIYLTASGHVLKGKNAPETVREHEFQQAEGLLDKMQRIQGPPKLVRAVLWLQSEIAKSRGDQPEARRLEKLANDAPLQTAREFHRAAASAMERKDFAQALKLLEESLRRDPADFNSWFVLGVCHDAMGHFRESASIFATCIALRPDFYAAHYNRGLAYLKQRKYSEARQDFDQAIHLNEEFVDSYLHRSMTYLEPEEQGLAESDLSEAIRLLPDRSRLHLLRAKVRDRIGNPTGAEEDRQKGFDLEPKDPIDWVTRGMARLPKDPKTALADLDEALQIEPSYLSALENKAHILAQYFKDSMASIAVLTQIIRHYPDDARARAGRGVLFARLEKSEEALRDAEASLALDNSPSNQYQIAGIYALLSKRNPDASPEAFRLLGAALSRGFGFQFLDDDPELNPLRDDPRFKRTIEMARQHTEKTGR